MEFRGATARRQKWKSRINIKGKEVFLGMFDTKADAALAFDLYYVLVDGKDAHPNFSFSIYAQELQHRHKMTPERLVMLLRRQHGRILTSRYHGVSFCKFTKKWHVQMSVDGRNVHMGFYTSEQEAAVAHDEDAVKHHGVKARINFPFKNYLHLLDPKDHEAAKQSDERAAKVAQENAEWEANADKIHNWLHHFEKLKANPQAYHPDLPTDYQQLLGKDGAPGGKTKPKRGPAKPKATRRTVQSKQQNASRKTEATEDHENEMGDDGDKMDVSEGESSWATDDEDFPSDNDVDCMLAEMPADWDISKAGIPLSKEMEGGAQEVQRMLMHSIIEYSGMTEAQLQQRMNCRQKDLDKMRDSNPWVAILEEEQHKLTAHREKMAQAMVDTLMEDDEPLSPKPLLNISDFPDIVRECVDLSWRCCTGNEAESVAALQESLRDWDPEELAFRTSAEMPLAVNLLMSKAQDIPIAETLPPVPGQGEEGFDPNCPYTQVLELAKKQLAHENCTLDFSRPQHMAALRRLALEHEELRPRMVYGATLAVLRESSVPQEWIDSAPKPEFPPLPYYRLVNSCRPFSDSEEDDEELREKRFPVVHLPGGSSGVSRKRMGYPPKPGTRHEPPDYYQKLPFEWDYSNLSPEDFPSWVGKIGPILATLPPPPKLSDFVDAYYARQNAKRQEQQQQGQAEQEADMSNQAASTSQAFQQASSSYNPPQAMSTTATMSAVDLVQELFGIGHDIPSSTPEAHTTASPNTDDQNNSQESTETHAPGINQGVTGVSGAGGLWQGNGVLPPFPRPEKLLDVSEAPKSVREGFAALARKKAALLARSPALKALQEKADDARASGDLASLQHLSETLCTNPTNAPAHNTHPRIDPNPEIPSHTSHDKNTTAQDATNTTALPVDSPSTVKGVNRNESATNAAAAAAAAIAAAAVADTAPLENVACTAAAVQADFNTDVQMQLLGDEYIGANTANAASDALPGQGVPDGSTVDGSNHGMDAVACMRGRGGAEWTDNETSMHGNSQEECTASEIISGSGTEEESSSPSAKATSSTKHHSQTENKQITPKEELANTSRHQKEVQEQSVHPFGGLCSPEQVLVHPVSRLQKKTQEESVHPSRRLRSLQEQPVHPSSPLRSLQEDSVHPSSHQKHKQAAARCTTTSIFSPYNTSLDDLTRSPERKLARTAEDSGALPSRIPHMHAANHSNSTLSPSQGHQEESREPSVHVEHECVPEIRVVKPTHGPSQSLIPRRHRHWQFQSLIPPTAPSAIGARLLASQRHALASLPGSLQGSRGGTQKSTASRRKKHMESTRNTVKADDSSDSEENIDEEVTIPDLASESESDSDSESDNEDVTHVDSTCDQMPGATPKPPSGCRGIASGSMQQAKALASCSHAAPTTTCPLNTTPATIAVDLTAAAPESTVKQLWANANQAVQKELSSKSVSTMLRRSGRKHVRFSESLASKNRDQVMKPTEKATVKSQHNAKSTPTATRGTATLTAASLTELLSTGVPGPKTSRPSALAAKVGRTATAGRENTEGGEKDMVLKRCTCCLQEWKGTPGGSKLSVCSKCAPLKYHVRKRAKRQVKHAREALQELEVDAPFEEVLALGCEKATTNAGTTNASTTNVATANAGTNAGTNAAATTAGSTPEPAPRKSKPPSQHTMVRTRGSRSTHGAGRDTKTQRADGTTSQTGADASGMPGRSSQLYDSTEGARAQDGADAVSKIPLAKKSEENQEGRRGGDGLGGSEETLAQKAGGDSQNGARVTRASAAAAMVAASQNVARSIEAGIGKTQASKGKAEVDITAAATNSAGHTVTNEHVENSVSVAGLVPAADTADSVAGADLSAASMDAAQAAAVAATDCNEPVNNLAARSVATCAPHAAKAQAAQLTGSVAARKDSSTSDVTATAALKPSQAQPVYQEGTTAPTAAAAATALHADSKDLQKCSPTPAAMPAKEPPRPAPEHPQSAVADPASIPSQTQPAAAPLVQATATAEVPDKASPHGLGQDEVPVDPTKDHQCPAPAPARPHPQPADADTSSIPSHLCSAAAPLVHPTDTPLGQVQLQVDLAPYCCAAPQPPCSSAAATGSGATAFQAAAEKAGDDAKIAALKFNDSADQSQEPVKRGRGRPRKYPLIYQQPKQAPVQPAQPMRQTRGRAKTQPLSQAPTQPPKQEQPEVAPVKRGRGRPRKYPLPAPANPTPTTENICAKVDDSSSNQAMKISSGSAQKCVDTAANKPAEKSIKEVGASAKRTSRAVRRTARSNAWKPSSLEASTAAVKDVVGNKNEAELPSESQQTMPSIIGAGKPGTAHPERVHIDVAEASPPVQETAFRCPDASQEPEYVSTVNLLQALEESGTPGGAATSVFAADPTLSANTRTDPCKETAVAAMEGPATSSEPKHEAAPIAQTSVTPSAARSTAAFAAELTQDVPAAAACSPPAAAPTGCLLPLPAAAAAAAPKSAKPSMPPAVTSVEPAGRSPATAACTPTPEKATSHKIASTTPPVPSPEEVLTATLDAVLDELLATSPEASPAVALKGHPTLPQNSPVVPLKVHPSSPIVSSAVALEVHPTLPQSSRGVALKGHPSTSKKPPSTQQQHIRNSPLAFNHDNLQEVQDDETEEDCGDDVCKGAHETHALESQDEMHDTVLCVTGDELKLREAPKARLGKLPAAAACQSKSHRFPGSQQADTEHDLVVAAETNENAAAHKNNTVALAGQQVLDRKSDVQPNAAGRAAPGTNSDLGDDSGGFGRTQPVSMPLETRISIPTPLVTSLGPFKTARAAEETHDVHSHMQQCMVPMQQDDSDAMHADSVTELSPVGQHSPTSVVVPVDTPPLPSVPTHFSAKQGTQNKNMFISSAYMAPEGVPVATRLPSGVSGTQRPFLVPKTAENATAGAKKTLQTTWNLRTPSAMHVYNATTTQAQCISDASMHVSDASACSNVMLPVVTAEHAVAMAKAHAARSAQHGQSMPSMHDCQKQDSQNQSKANSTDHSTQCTASMHSDAHKQNDYVCSRGTEDFSQGHMHGDDAFDEDGSVDGWKCFEKLHHMNMHEEEPDATIDELADLFGFSGTLSKFVEGTIEGAGDMFGPQYKHQVKHRMEAFQNLLRSGDSSNTTPPGNPPEACREYMAALGLWKDFYASVVDELEQCEFTEHMLRSKSRRERSMRAEPPLWVPELAELEDSPRHPWTLPHS